MLGNLFKPKWLHKDAKVRIQAISSLAGDSVELIKLAQTDPDLQVRMEAILRLTHIPTLVQLGHTSGSLAERAQQRVLILAATDHHHDHLLADVFHWLQNPALLQSLSRDSERGVKLRRHALESLTDQELLFDIASKDASKEIQFIAANRISDLEKLKLLDKQHGKNNKRLRQLLKERLDHEQARLQQQQQTDKLCEDAEKLGQLGGWAQEKTRMRILQQSWKQFTHRATTVQQTRFQNAIDAFQQRLTAHEAEQADINQKLAEAAAERAQLEAQAQELAEQAAQAEQEKREREQQTQAEERKRRKQQQALQSETLQQLHADLCVLENNLETEQYSEAIEQHQALLLKLKETTDLPRHEIATIQERLKLLAPYLRELQDWRRWSTDQVRKQLIETAENLRSDDDLDPQERAKKVQSLREEWRKLAQLEPGQQRTLWKTFDSTVTAAYEVSKQHFAEQAKQREIHLEQRNALCAQLETLETATDWENADWRDLQNQINQLRKQWKEAGTIGHKDWKTVNDRFNAAMDTLETHFKTERSRNWAEREQLVAEATALLDNPDTPAAIEQAKALQGQWQITLASRPADEQRLWKQFREPIDALFARSREERQQKRQERDAQTAENARLEAEKQQRALERQQQKRAELEALAAQSLTNKQTETDVDTQTANQTAGEWLCMQMEILLNLETPAAFQQTRMEYQIAQMRDAMCGRKEESNPSDQALPLLKQWYALGGMPETALLNQTARIQTIIAAL